MVRKTGKYARACMLWQIFHEKLLIFVFLKLQFSNPLCNSIDITINTILDW